MSWDPAFRAQPLTRHWLHPQWHRNSFCGCQALTWLLTISSNTCSSGGLGCVILFYSVAEFLSLDTVDIWGLVIVCCRGAPMHCMIFSSTLVVCSLQANSTPPSLTTTNISLETAQCHMGAEAAPAGNPQGCRSGRYTPWLESWCHHLRVSKLLNCAFTSLSVK